MDTTPSLAKGTASIKLSGRAEKATVAELEALEPKARGEAALRHKTPLQGKARHEVKTQPRKGEREVDPPPQGSLNEGKRGGGHGALRQSNQKHLRRHHKWTRQKGGWLFEGHNP